jgi:hypothetical protein
VRRAKPRADTPSRSVANAAFLRVQSLLPHGSGKDDSPNDLLLLAAGALLAFVLASGSLVTVLARFVPPTAVLLLVLGAPAVAHAETVTASCATPSGNIGCDRWYSSPSVTLVWAVDPVVGASIQGCANGTFTAQARITRSCRADWSNGAFAGRTLWIGIDRTAPNVTSFATGRPPDFNGWFNHPVGVQFQGTDPLSGIGSCSGATYSGPEGAGVPVAGSCTDVAGNTGSASLPISYDSTPPPEPEVSAAPRDNAVKVEWTSSPDAQAQVARVRDGRSTVVYQGGGDAFTDRKLRNERRYRYVVRLIDQAGNRAAASDSAVPTDSPLLTPAAGESVHAPPLLTWHVVKRAGYYNVQLFKGTRKVLSRWPKTNELQLKRRWSFAGRRHRLGAGRYCWHVWPGFGRRAKRNYGELLGSRCFRVAG